MTETRIHRFAAVVAALLAGLLPLVAQTVPDTLRQTDRIMSRMDSLQKVMRGRKDTLRTIPAFFGAPLNEAAADAPLVSGNPDDTLPGRPVWTAPRLLARGDSLRRAYAFAESVNAYREALRLCDSTLSGPYQDSLLLGQNALSMMEYCSRPVVVARQRFSRKDFFLYYPLEDRSWRPSPNPLDSLGKGAMYIDPDARTLYYSAMDEDGIRNLYRTRDLDSLWSVPELINEQITSQSDEIFPMLSADGKSLYFASRGLYGMGGYDLYVSHWNPETHDWDVPMNLGFPYSSPFDDFLFINSDDGKYSMFASNRECSRDSVYIYVLEYDSMPVRQALSDERQVQQLSCLHPSESGTYIDNKNAVDDPIRDNPETQEYMRQMKLVRSLRDSIYAFGQALDEERAALSTLPENQRAAAMEAVLEKELALPAMNDSLKRATATLQQIEMDFLMKGVVIDPSRVKADAEKEVVGASSGYAFTRKTMGPALDIRVQKPKPTFDYTFMVLPEGRFAENNTLPAGLVYQIQLFSSTSKATVKQLRGLSPVFEKSGGSRYTYSAGVFRSYKDVLANLNKAKRQGFRNAFIVAYNDGKSLSVQQARNLEKTKRPIYWLKVYPPDGQALPSLALSAIQQQGAKDIMRGVEEGSVVFTCGPFANRDDAEGLRVSLRAVGVSRVDIEEKISD